MPLYLFVCADAHETGWFGSHADRPETVPCETCRGEARYSLATTATPYPKEPAVEREAVTVKGSAPRFGLLRWECLDCAVTFQEVLAREEEDAARENGRPCPKCEKPAKWVPSWHVDRFAERIDTDGGYYDRGLGMRITSPAHRREVCKQRGLTPVDGDWDHTMDQMFRREDDQRDREVREIADYDDRVEHSPVYAGYRRARDLGIV